MLYQAESARAPAFCGIAAHDIKLVQRRQVIKSVSQNETQVVGCAGSGKAAAQERKRAELAAALAVYAAKARLAAAAGPGHRSAPLQEDGEAGFSYCTHPLGRRWNVK